MIVLGIESSCDETGAAIIKDGVAILSNVVATQDDIHSKYGGVFPELASRRHVDVLIPIIDEALLKARLTLSDIDLIAVTTGPGLIGALSVGINAAKTLALALKKPIIGINHVEAHIYAAIMSQKEVPAFPSLGVVLSGAHTNLVYIKEIGDYELLSFTIDDAIGEAFDKVAKIMDIPYPGGPKIEILAKEGDPNRFSFKAGRVKKKPHLFSFSGIKTAVLYAVKGQNGNLKKDHKIPESDKAHIAASFQQAVFQDVIVKTLKTAKLKNCTTLLFGGGVTNNMHLREMFETAANKHNLLWPNKGLSLDNAAMIAGLGYWRYKKKGISDPLDIDATPRLNF